VCGQLVVVVPVASTFVPADPDAVVPDAVVSEDDVPSCAPRAAGWPVPPSDTGWSPDDGAGLVIGSVEPSVLSGAGFGSSGCFVTSGVDDPESGVDGLSESDSEAGPGTSASLGVPSRRTSGPTDYDSDGLSETADFDDELDSEADGDGGVAGDVVERAVGLLSGGVDRSAGSPGDVSASFAARNCCSWMRRLPSSPRPPGPPR
jgi:hypothetical protein